jgi:hypothetical protein
MARQLAVVTRTMVLVFVGVLVGRLLPGSWTPFLLGIGTAAVGESALWWLRRRRTAV